MDDDGGVYFVQLRGFLQDQYCNKSAVITWLLPTTATQSDSFDPSTYILGNYFRFISQIISQIMILSMDAFQTITCSFLGPEEDIPRCMECFEFVCHAPSEYYKCINSPFGVKHEGPDMAYVSTTMGAQIRRLPSRDAIFGLKDIENDESPEVVVSHKEKTKEKSKEREEKKERSSRDRKERKETRERGRDKKGTKDN